MGFTKRGVFIVYLNLLLVTAIVTLAVGSYVRQTKVESEKRQLYVDMLGVRCDQHIKENPDYCGHGDCKPLNIDDEEGPKICYCWQGFTSYLHVCDLQKLPQFNAFMSSFFGGWVGADWFYLFRTGTSGGYIAAGVFKLLTGGGFSIWWVIDWCRVLTLTFPDGLGYDLFENLTDSDLGKVSY